MSTWSKIESYLFVKLSKHLTKRNQTKLKSILNIIKLDRTLRIIACNMAIDIKSNSISTNLVAEKLSGIKKINVNDLFSEIKKTFKSYKFNSSHKYSGNLDSNDCYVRVLTIENFVRFYGHEFGWQFSNPKDIDKAIDFFRTSKFGNEISLESKWTGEDDIVWITSYDKLKSNIQQVKKISPLNDATIVNLILGLGHKKSHTSKPELVGIVYPIKNKIKTRQPTFIDGSLNLPVTYISFKQLDSWGRTVCLSGEYEACVERLHKGFPNGIDQNYKKWYLGEYEDIDDVKIRQSSANYEAIAYIRFNDIK